MTWAPMTSIPDPVQMAFHDAVRATIASIESLSGVTRMPDGYLSIPLANGNNVYVKYEIQSKEPAAFGERDAIRYYLDGAAVVDNESIALSAEALVDLKTMAFVDIRSSIQWRRKI